MTPLNTIQKTSIIKRIDFIEGQLAVLEVVEKFGIGAAAAAKGFEGKGQTGGVAQMAQEQAGENGLADGGIGPGDEDNARLAKVVHA